MIIKTKFYERKVGKDLTSLLKDVKENEKKIELKVMPENLPEKYQEPKISNLEVTKSVSSSGWEFIKNLGKYIYAFPTFKEDLYKSWKDDYFEMIFGGIFCHNVWYIPTVAISDTLNFDNPYTTAGIFIPLATNAVSGIYETFRSKKLKEQKKLKLEQK